ncbi:MULTISPECIES: methyl-accepting chemotaxis protein [Pseudomonas]|uniref:methyl-accepting chemotaxis protein n=1 Tax=Pseudomonas TaxID=286 RepID=UPI002096D943|nr:MULTISPECIES: methyl-accepting chemotaxis protein [Pseudomonas]MCO7506352.1 methyl-accepting chemotaxis protein [Pseudomonas sp. VE 267-6A]MCO7531656.1 methyl-accepting chemotaxis protein [Pseudomonas sp. 2]MCO7575864.1 methyl-accepting chemotaxis protein [Pseudomonas protegens]MCO7581298.1 methyl-accepting chemotaxis protein [Pseudomonas chlororaphis]MCO7597677.1 methyl-accepting chemotaxis protein [Pseudomonas chlororaphis]
MSLRNMNIGSRAGLGFTIIGFLVLAMGLIALFQANEMDDATAEIRVEWLPAVQDVGEIGSGLGRTRALTLRTLTMKEGDQLKETVGLVRRINQEISAFLINYEKGIDSPDDRKLFEDFKSSYAKYLSYQERILDGVLASVERGDEIEVANGPLASAADQMMAALNKLIKFNEQGAVHAADQTSKAFDAAVFMIVVALILILMLMVVIAIVLTRSIVSPLSEAVIVADRVSSGDLTQNIHVTGSDEPAHLLIALKRMQDSLHETIEKISESSTMLASASEELHAVTEDTNRGLNQQSAEIDQAATAVNQMTAAVEEVARNAVNTADDSKAADKSTYQGREKVSQALESINRLVGNVSDTSEEVKLLAQNANEISQVLVVIRSIAEQTNLLALNAAIEAARAGEAGRGFAVVADEVRALAYRTQQSTGEIEKMIEGIQSGTDRAVDAMNESQERANGTLQVAREANDALDVIGEAIASINQKNLVIASASEEQAQVAREVDKNLVNIRDLSMQTSAGANQTNASSQELSRLAVDLHAMVSKFRL